MGNIRWATGVAAIVSAIAFAGPAPENVAGESNNAFGSKLFTATTKRTGKGNKFLSPTSAYFALALAANGATGATREAMEEALAVKALGRDGMNVANGKLMKALLARGEGSELSIANALWLAEDLPVKDAYLERVRTHYKSRVDRLDFSTPAAAQTINAWTRKETRDKITSIVPDRLPADTRLILTNAVYFKAKWEAPFLAMNTALRAFDNGKTRVEVPTMYSRGEYRYARLDDGSEAIALPYRDGKTEMIVWLPKHRDLAAAEKDVAAGDLAKIGTLLATTKPSKGSLTLPKVRFEYEAPLNEGLVAVGMKAAFSAGADFSDLTERGSPISGVLQKTFIAIDEEGTEAAAVTGIVFGSAGIGEPDAFELKVDRPFVFAIRDRATGTLLFLGSIQEPEGGKLPPPPKPR